MFRLRVNPLSEAEERKFNSDRFVQGLSISLGDEVSMSCNLRLVLYLRTFKRKDCADAVVVVE